jgi:hypothetical protein
MQKVHGISKHGNRAHILAPSSANVEPRVRRAIFSRQPFLPQNKVRSSELNLAGQGYQKLKALLTSHGLPEMTVNRRRMYAQIFRNLPHGQNLRTAAEGVWAFHWIN